MERFFSMPKPVRRSSFRRMLGSFYYGTRRKLKWIRMRSEFARTRSEEPLAFSAASHHTPLFRQLKDVDQWMQRNKVVNLRLAVKQLNGLVIHPGETFSYWYLIGNPSRRKGYLPGMVLQNGTLRAGVGGGLCQLSNLIFWMALHTPLTVLERHRHGYDVFPDANRTQPFGSGATCYYPHGDLMLRNDTQSDYQLLLRVGETELEGEWRCEHNSPFRYEIVERNHRMQREAWGGYSRHNQLYRQCYDLAGNLLDEELVVENAAIMMYAPFLPPPEEEHE